jgi:5-methylcytosine-specific restriction endonuclease McrA
MNKKAVFRRFRGECFYCGREVHEPHVPQCPLCSTIDHVFSKKYGGSNRLANLVLACRECNEGKDKLAKAVRAVSSPVRGCGHPRYKRAAAVFRAMVR